MAGIQEAEEEAIHAWHRSSINATSRTYLPCTHLESVCECDMAQVQVLDVERYLVG